MSVITQLSKNRVGELLLLVTRRMVLAASAINVTSGGYN